MYARMSAISLLTLLICDASAEEIVPEKYKVIESYPYESKLILRALEHLVITNPSEFSAQDYISNWLEFEKSRVSKVSGYIIL